MRLRRLIADLPVGPPPMEDPEITAVTHDSRRVRPGTLFVAVPGARVDGREFALQAAERGAAAVLGRGTAPAGLAVPWLTCDQPRALLGPLAARFHGHPDERLTLVGVTGTNGKSTLVALVAAVLEAAGRPAGVLGTLGYHFRERSFDHAFADGRTTPEATDLFAVLAAMADDGATAVAMEVSSHALALGRVAGLRFDVAAFTNLSHDHLDFHRDLDDYFAAKRRLFDQLADDGRAVVNAGDPRGRELAAAIPDALTYGLDVTADVTARDVELDLDGIRAIVVTPRGELPLRCPLLGRYNLENLLAAVAVAEALELPHPAVAAALERQRAITGRMERVDGGQDFPILLDYAHTPAALEAALSSLRELLADGGRRIVLIFGCGGDRDRDKRRPMGELAGRLADRAFATSDNPRDEDPEAILATVEAGLVASGAKGYRVIPDRREAIRAAVGLAAAEDDRWAVLVAGKGHETVQVIGDRTLPFSDRDEILAALAAAGGKARHG